MGSDPATWLEAVTFRRLLPRRSCLGLCFGRASEVFLSLCQPCPLENQHPKSPDLSHSSLAKKAHESHVVPTRLPHDHVPFQQLLQSPPLGSGTDVLHVQSRPWKECRDAVQMRGRRVATGEDLNASSENLSFQPWLFVPLAHPKLPELQRPACKLLHCITPHRKTPVHHPVTSSLHRFIIKSTRTRSDVSLLEHP